MYGQFGLIISKRYIIAIRENGEFTGVTGDVVGPSWNRKQTMEVFTNLEEAERRAKEYQDKDNRITAAYKTLVELGQAPPQYARDNEAEYIVFELAPVSRVDMSAVPSLTKGE